MRNNGAVGAKRNGEVVWNERGAETRRNGRVRFNIGVVGDRIIVRRFGCIVNKRERWVEYGGYICEQTSRVDWILLIVIELVPDAGR